MKFFFLTINAAWLIIFGACSSTEEKCIELIPSPVVKVEGKTTAKPGEEVLITMTVAYHNGCGSFAYLEETSKGREKNIMVTGKFEGCACSMAIVEGQTGYLFKTRERGTWKLRFKNGDQPEVIHEIVVE